MYRYVSTTTRVHRVVMNGGQAFRVPQCNLSDRALLSMVDLEPAGVHCPWCWVGWEPSTLEEAEQHAGCADANPTPPPGARGTPMVEATRRLAMGAIVGTAVLGLAAGVLFSPDLATAEPDDLADRLAGVDGRIDTLLVEMRTLSDVVVGHDHAATEIVVTFPTPVPTFGPPAPGPSASPTTSPDRPSDTTIVIVPQDAPAPAPVVVVRPSGSPTPQPTPVVTPDPTPCTRPGKPKSGKDPCSWPAN